MTSRDFYRLMICLICLFTFLISFVIINRFFNLNNFQIINLSLFITIISFFTSYYCLLKPQHEGYISKITLLIVVLFLLLLVVPVKFESYKIKDFNILKGENYVFIEVLDENVDISRPYIVDNSIKLYKKDKEDIILYIDVNYCSLNDEVKEKLRYEIKN